MSIYPQVKLKKREERRVLSGHCWVYSNEIDTSKMPLTSYETGQIVDIISSSGKWVGNAYINPHSLISARIVSRDKDHPFTESLIVHRLKVALALRERLYAEPFYRLVYGESDFLPGLVIDRYGDVLVIQINTAGMEAMKDEIVRAVEKVLKPKSIVLRCDNNLRKLENIELYSETLGEIPSSIVIPEHGAEFEVDLAKGQKTGWFYDQRDNREQLLKLVKDKTVIDVCSYVGAWGVGAAVAGAKRVICVDSSEYALEQVAINAQRNNVSDKVLTAQGDAFDILKGLRADDEKADIVILDPPAFVKRKKDLKNGAEGYARLMRRGLQLIERDGIMVSCSCSYHMQRNDFISNLNQAGRHIDRSLQIFHEGRQSQDHPIHPAMPETEYLKVLFARVLPRA